MQDVYLECSRGKRKEILRERKRGVKQIKTLLLWSKRETVEGLC